MGNVGERDALNVAQYTIGKGPNKESTMSRVKLPLAVLMVLQVLAVILYPPDFFRRAPQAIVLPPALLLFFVLGIVGLNTRSLSAAATKTLLIFVQGLNILMRLIMLLPNLRTPAGNWAWGLLIAQLIGIGLSWFTMTALERHTLEGLRLSKAAREDS
jgi:hypothetical protein